MSFLQKVVKMWNEEFTLDGSVEEELMNFATDEFAHVIKRQFSNSHKRDKIGMSQFGKAEVLLALAHLDKSVKQKTTGRTQYTFFTGDVFEIFMCLFITKYVGFDVEDMQREVTYRGYKGHIDFVCQGRLVELKTLNEYSFKEFRDNPSDAVNGYFSQLTLYHYTTGLPASWLILNKWSGELCEVEYHYDPDAMARIDYIIDSLQNINEVDDIKKYFVPPEPEEKRGKLYIPRSMKYEDLSVLKMFYNTKDGITVSAPKKSRRRVV